MFGIGILVALGRRVATAALADTGLLPAGFYRHLALAALEEEDFPRALKWLPFAAGPGAYPTPGPAPAFAGRQAQ